MLRSDLKALQLLLYFYFWLGISSEFDIGNEKCLCAVMLFANMIISDVRIMMVFDFIVLPRFLKASKYFSCRLSITFCSIMSIPGRCDVSKKSKHNGQR